MLLDSDQNTKETLMKTEHPHVVISIGERLDLRNEILIPFPKVSLYSFTSYRIPN